MKQSKTEKIINIIMSSVSYIIGILVAWLNYGMDIININLAGLDSVLESIVNYTSIIIGVLIALFGIIVTLTDKDIMVKLQKGRGDKTIFRYSVETLISNFILLILTIFLQSVVKMEPHPDFANFTVQIWFFMFVFSIVSSVRTIFYLLLISFNQNDKTKRPESKY